MHNYKAPATKECRYCGEQKQIKEFHQGTLKCSECRMRDDRVRREVTRNRERFACTDWRPPA